MIYMLLFILYYILLYNYILCNIIFKKTYEIRLKYYDHSGPINTWYINFWSEIRNFLDIIINRYKIINYKVIIIELKNLLKFLANNLL